MASRISTLILPDNLNELRETTNLLLQQKQTGNKSDKIDEQIVATADKLLQYRYISTKQHKTSLVKV